jgi:hypothetical protein
MQIHQVVHDSALEVVLNLVDNDLFANVDQLDICEVTLILVYCLINLFVVSNAIAEIGRGNLRVLADVVWGRRLDFQYVAHDEVFVVAFGLDEESLDIVRSASFLYPPSSALCRVCRIQNCNQPLALGKPLAHVIDSCFGGCFSEALSFWV